MTELSPAHTGPISPYPFSYYNIRRITSPEDDENGRQIYVGSAPLSTILDLPVDENVRDYLLKDKKRKVYSQVHQAIWDTLEYNPQDFSVLNSGIAIVAHAAEIQDKQRLILLRDASIINGSQTQGVVRDYYGYLSDRGLLPLDPEPHVKFEIVVTEDDDLIAEVSIARNFQNAVKRISMVARRGYLEELDQAFRRDHPNLVLRKKETDLPYDDNNIVNTERLIQVIAALVPEELWVKSGEFNKVYTYSQKTKCLKEFEQIFLYAHDSDHPRHSEYARLYKFYLDVPGQAYDIYRKWKTHQGFIGTRIRAIKRNESREVEDVPDGIVFPILASLSVFATETANGWRVLAPSIDDELIQTADTNYKEVAGHNPNAMGKSKACYSALYQLTSIAKRWKITEPFI